MARGVVDVDIHADHKLQLFDGPFNPPPVWRGQNRIARNGDQRLDLPVACGFHFLGHDRDREFAVVQRLAGHTRPRLGIAAHLAFARCHARIIECRRGEHRTALGVKVSGDDIKRICRPQRQPAKALG